MSKSVVDFGKKDDPLLFNYKTWNETINELEQRLKDYNRVRSGWDRQR